MYIWSENVASRGAQEIGSVLIYHFKIYVPSTTHYIILYSDSCGGQNRKIKLTLMLKKILCDQENINKIEQKYFVVGHSYNSCDRCFALIERQKKRTENIFSPQHWVDLIQQAKKSEPKFVVTQLGKDDFFSSRSQEELIQNRKNSCEGERINWFSIHRIINNACDPFVLEVGIYGDTSTKKVDIQKKGVTLNDFISSEMLPLSERMISQEKYKDLMDLLKFIPREYHAFYEGLANKSDVEDLGLASGSSDIDEEEE